MKRFVLAAVVAAAVLGAFEAGRAAAGGAHAAASSNPNAGGNLGDLSLGENPRNRRLPSSAQSAVRDLNLGENPRNRRLPSSAESAVQSAAQPDIRTVDLKGLEQAIAAERGKPLLVNFWAIWCQPCVEELPEFLEVGREARSRGGVVLTVSYDLMVPDVTREGVLKQMRAYVAAHKIDAPVLIYDAPDYDAINARFGLPGPVPATIAIDRNGQVVDRFAGKADRAKFEAMMRKARGEQGDPTVPASARPTIR